MTKDSASPKSVPLGKLEVERLMEACNVELLKYRREYVPEDFLDTAAETFLTHVYRSAFLAGVKAYSEVIVQDEAT